MIGAFENRNFLGVAIVCTTRLICIMSLAWFGLIVANAVGSLKSKNGVAIENVTIVNEPSLYVPELLLPGAGHWSFAQTELSIQQIWCSGNELAGRLENLKSLGASKLESTRDASDLVELAKSNGATQTNCEAGSAWTFADSHLQICLVTTNSKTPRLRAAAFAVKDAQQWQLTILNPQPPSDEHMLPLPSEAKTPGSQQACSQNAALRTTCSRRNEAGELQMELVSTSLSDEELLAYWGDCGWEIRHTPWGIAGSFSYLCACGEDVVYAWSDDSAGRRTLMLTSSAMVKRRPKEQPKQQTTPVSN